MEEIEFPRRDNDAGLDYDILFAIFGSNDCILAVSMTVEAVKDPSVLYPDSLVLKTGRYVISFLKEHGKETYTEIRAAYVDTMNKVLSAHFRAYIQALEKLQLDIATSSDLIGVETRSTSLFSRGREPLKNRSAVFALGERINILKVIDLKRFLKEDDTRADSRRRRQRGPFAVIDEHFNSILPNCFDAIGIMLMIRIIHHHQLSSIHLYMVLIIITNLKEPMDEQL
ncbi:hypothetical protein RJ639_008512 [Escallonia herrerae]|uniref:Vps52 C-terminal domain-containing protein n=1 Tax=Escallonia herrerae TaxID=1293975 RepID=A0AA89AWE2_9ASTE|nr:hypothetical protein RJ639_008512 [Escallonia herrerae]